MAENIGELKSASFVNSAREQMRHNENVNGRKAKQKYKLNPEKFLKFLAYTFLVVGLFAFVANSARIAKANNVTVEPRTGFTITETQRNAYEEPGSNALNGR